MKETDWDKFEKIADEAWLKVSDAFMEFKKQVINYRKLSSLTGRKDDAWYFGYAIGCCNFTSDDEEALKRVEEGFYEGRASTK